MYIGNKKIILKNKRRFSCFLVCMCLIGIFILNTIFLHKAEGYESSNLKIIVVTQGDTLWDIVSKSSDKEADIRREIYHVRKINNLETSYVYPGQQLMIPTGE